jgi:hypothetical protein
MDVPIWFRVLCWSAPPTPTYLTAIFSTDLTAGMVKSLRPNHPDRIPIA